MAAQYCRVHYLKRHILECSMRCLKRRLQKCRILVESFSKCMAKITFSPCRLPRVASFKQDMQILHGVFTCFLFAGVVAWDSIMCYQLSLMSRMGHRQNVDPATCIFNISNATAKESIKFGTLMAAHRWGTGLKGLKGGLLWGVVAEDECSSRGEFAFRWNGNKAKRLSLFSMPSSLHHISSIHIIIIYRFINRVAVMFLPVSLKDLPGVICATQLDASIHHVSNVYSHLRLGFLFPGGYHLPDRFLTDSMLLQRPKWISRY